MRILVTIVDAEGSVQRRPAFGKAEITIGRAPANDVVLPDAGASSSHARVVATGGSLTLIDLDSTNGTYVNEDRVTAPHILATGDKVLIGDFTLLFEFEGAEEPDEPDDDDYDRTGLHLVPNSPPAPAASGDDWPEPPPMMDEMPASGPEGAPASSARRSTPPTPSAAPRSSGSAMFPRLPVGGVSAPAPERLPPPRPPDSAPPPSPAAVRVAFEFAPAPQDVLLDRVFRAVWRQIESHVDAARPGARDVASRALDDALRAAARVGTLPRLDRIKDHMLSELAGPGPIPDLLEGDPDELLLIGTNRVRITRGGHVSEGPGVFTCAAALAHWVSDVCQVRFGPESPSAAGSFGQYSVHAVHDSTADGSVLISLRRRRSRGEASMESLINAGVVSANIAALLSGCVAARLNLVLCAGPGASVIPAMAALFASAPSIELQAVVLNAGADVAAFREGTLLIRRGGSGSPSIEDAMALGPDRLGVDELTPTDFASATSMVSRTVSQILGLRAASAGAGLSKLETMLGSAAPVETARSLLAGYVDVIVATQLFADGLTRVTQVSEPTFDESGRLVSRDIFTLVPGSRNWQFTGIMPRCYEDMTRRGFLLDPSIFA